MRRRAVPIAPILIGIAIAAAVAIPACGDGDGALSTGFERAIATAGEGASPTGTGVGWVDLDALAPGDLGWARLALAPEASIVLGRHAAVQRRLGFDPAAASQATSLAGSYAFGVRFDGIAPGRLGPELERAGATAHAAGEWTDFDLGDQFVGQPSGPLAVLGALSARAATAPDAVMLARATQARDSLTAEQDGALSGGRLDRAAECLGDVVAARAVPGAFTHNQLAAPVLIAFGVGPTREDGTRTEVLCAIDLPSAAIEDRAAAMRRALAPDAVDPLSGERMGELVSSVAVGTTDGDDGETVTRAVLERPAGSRPGLLLRAFPRGSLLTYLGAPRP